MRFCIGDRVRYVGRDPEGEVEFGESGTVVGEDSWEDAVVEWDESSPNRHDCDGLTKAGYGWYTQDCHLELIEEVVDLGEIPPDLELGFIAELLGG